MAAERTTEKPLERYMRVLEVISGFPQGISPSAVAEMLSLPKASAYRLIRGLADVGLVEMTAPPSATCRLGERLQKLLFSGASDEWLKTVAAPILTELCEEIGEACYLARLSGNVVRSIEMVAPNQRLWSYIVPGQVIIPNAGASAKAILAFRDEATVEQVLTLPLTAYTSATKTDLEELKTELAEVRRSRIAYCVGEDVDGFAAIAAPIVVPGFDVQLSVAATGTISSLIEKKKEEVTDKLTVVADKIATLLAQRNTLELAAE